MTPKPTCQTSFAEKRKKKWIYYMRKKKSEKRNKEGTWIRRGSHNSSSFFLFLLLFFLSLIFYLHSLSLFSPWSKFVWILIMCRLQSVLVTRLPFTKKSFCVLRSRIFWATWKQNVLKNSPFVKACRRGTSRVLDSFWKKLRDEEEPLFFSLNLHSRKRSSAQNLWTWVNLSCTHWCGSWLQ